MSPHHQAVLALKQVPALLHACHRGARHGQADLWPLRAAVEDLEHTHQGLLYIPGEGGVCEGRILGGDWR